MDTDNDDDFGLGPSKASPRDILNAIAALGWMIDVSDESLAQPHAYERCIGILWAVTNRMIAEADMTRREDIHTGTWLVWDKAPGQWADDPGAHPCSIWAMAQALTINLMREHIPYAVPDGQGGDQDLAVAEILLNAAAEALMVAVPGPMPVTEQRHLRASVRLQVKRVISALAV